MPKRIKIFRGDRLKAVRGDISQEMLASAINIDQAQLARYETGASIIPASDLVLTPVERMQSLSKEIDAAKAQIARLALELVRQPPEAASVFQSEIDRASERISILRSELQQIATRNAAAANEQAAVNNALDTLRSMTVDEFFAQPTYAVNQWLRNYLQGYRFAVRDGEIVGLMPPR